MGEESPKPASTAAGAVFLSYASQDAEAAQRICESLRSAGIEVWFDQSELRGGEAWDRQIRQEIHDCRLFMAVISANSEQRDEGYFRREWRLAIERAGDMAEKKAFLVPVVIDGTSERGASVPDKFREVHWSHAPDGHASPAFIERMRHLMSPGPSHSPIVAQGSESPMSGAAPAGQGLPHSWVSRPAILVLALILIAGGAYVALDLFMKIGRAHV